MNSSNRAWWKEAAVYQVYPRSFRDSNGDGIGDLPGVMEKLPYLKELGIDVVWLSPVYPSPNCDNGYDICNYKDIMPEFGTMADFDRLLKEAHRLGLRLVLDLVVNHTSDEHPWFVQSRESRENPYRDFYIWREGKKGAPPNNWGSNFSGPAWSLDDRTGMYYLHLFAAKQPDLNWENPKVRDAVCDIMEFWLQKGVDGFRMDVINYISKASGLPDGPEDAGLYGSFVPHSVNGPRVHEYLRELNRRVLSKYDVMTVGETPKTTVEEARRYTGGESPELRMLIQFEHMELDGHEIGDWGSRRFHLKDLKRVLSKWQTGLDGCGWNCLYWNNHDQPRAVSRFGDDSTPLFWEKSAQMLAACLYLMQGTPFIYQGEELGMTNAAFDLNDYRDIHSRNAYDELVHQRGISHEKMMAFLHFASRDNARTPMQWDDSENAGFTSGTPWIKPNPNYLCINAHAQRHDERSVFSFYRHVLRLRKEYPVAVYGSYCLLLPDDERIYAYSRILGDSTLTVLCNFSREMSPVSGEFGRLLLTNYQEEEPQNSQALRPYETRVFLHEA